MNAAQQNGFCLKNNNRKNKFNYNESAKRYNS